MPTLKHLFTLHGVIALVNGAVIVVVPALYMSIFGITIESPDTIFISRLLGAALLTYGFVAWLARDAGPSDARQAIVLGFFISIAIGFVITLVAQLTGVMNTLGWALVALYFLMGLDYGFFYFVKNDSP
jgi:hypothetical protein